MEIFIKVIHYEVPQSNLTSVLRLVTEGFNGLENYKFSILNRCFSVFFHSDLGMKTFLGGLRGIEMFQSVYAQKCL